MRLSTFLLSCLMLVALIIGVKQCQTPDIPKKELSNDAVILAFGDSLTYGFGALPNESYPSVLSGLIHRKVINAGISGELSSQGLQRLPGVLDRYRPDLLLLCHGGNDILKKTESAVLRRNLEEMVRIAQQRNIDVIIIAVPEFSLLYLSAHPVYEEIAQRYHLPIESEILPEVLHDNRYKSDTIHPNAQGYRKMAEAVEKLLRESYEWKE